MGVWRHVGKEVFIRQEERHRDLWHEREDRWGHEQDQECCGDGMNIASGLSYDSVRMFNEQAKQLQQLERLGPSGMLQKHGEESSEEAEAEDKAVAESAADASA